MLTFPFKHADELRPHGHGHVGDEAGCQLLAVGHQVVARRDEEVGDVGEEVEEAASGSRDVCCQHREKREGKRHGDATQHFPPASHPGTCQICAQSVVVWGQDKDMTTSHSKAGA